MEAKKLTTVSPMTTDELGTPSHKEMLNYGTGYLGNNAVTALLGSFLIFYYTDVAGISTAVVGTMMIVIRLFDGVTDIGMGTLIDRTKSKHGKARPWILWSSIPLGITTVLVFSVPDISNTGKIIYAYTTYIALILVFTAFSVSLKTLLGLMTQVPQGRSLTNIYSGAFMLIATLVITVSAEPFASAVGGGFGWTLLALIVSVIIVLTSLNVFRSTTERIGANSQKKDSAPLLTSYQSLFSNKYWIIMTMYCVISYALIALIQGTGLYYSTYILGNTTYFSILGLGMFLPTIIGFIFITRLVNRFGKRNMALFFSFISIFGALIKLIDISSLQIVLIGTVIQGFGIIPIFVIMIAMINDTAQFGEWKSGIQTEGLVNSAASFGMKVGTGFGAAAVGWLLAYGGYIGASPTQSEEAINMIIVLSIFLPLILAVFQTVLLWFYKLDEHYETIIDDLNHRKKA